MPTEDDLRRLLGDADAPPSTLDASSIIRRSRRRRLPAQLGAGAAGVLAVAGIGVLVLPTVTNAPESATMSDSAPAMEGGGDTTLEYSELKRDPYAYLTCGAELPQAAGSMYGLEAELRESVLTVTNAATSSRSGVYWMPNITVTEDGIIVAHSENDGMSAGYPMDLAVGEAVDFDIEIPSIGCDGTELPTGDYEVVASLDFVPDVPDPDLPALTDLVVSPPIPLRMD
jgi:hypothetical protein